MEKTNDLRKTLGKLKLNKLSESKLEKKEMKVLKGGCGCKTGPGGIALVADGGGDY